MNCFSTTACAPADNMASAAAGSLCTVSAMTFDDIRLEFKDGKVFQEAEGTDIGNPITRKGCTDHSPETLKS